jgi:hypothetical protein
MSVRSSELHVAISGPTPAIGQSGVTAIARADSGFTRFAASVVVCAATGWVTAACESDPTAGIEGAEEPEHPMMLRETTKAAPLLSAAPLLNDDRTSRTFLFLERPDNRTSIEGPG